MANNDLGLKIKELRIRHNLTQRQLAKEFNVAGSTISNWETGTRLPSLHELKRLADFFNVSLSVFDPDAQADVPRTKESVFGRQIVDFRPLGLKLSKTSHLIFGLSVLLITRSELITFPVTFALVILGAIGLAIVFVGFLVEADRRHRTSFKRLMVAETDSVCYLHQSEEDAILGLQKKATIVSLVHLFSGVAFDALLLVVLMSSGSELLTAITSLYVLASLMTSVFHYRNVRGHVIIRKRIPYQMAFYDLKYPVLLIVLVMHVTALAGLSFFLAVDTTVNQGPVVWLTAFFGLLATSLSYLVYVTYHHFIRGYRLVRIASSGDVTTMM